MESGVAKQRDLPVCLGEAGRSQSLHSSDETGNDRGAKGGRKVKSQGKDDLPQGPATVAAKPRQAGNQRLSKASQGIWTRSMLETLERGIKGGRWYSLIDKVYEPEHLKLGALEVIRNKGAAGVDHRTVEQLRKEMDREVAIVARQLREGSFEASPVKRVWIEKLGSTELRPLGIPTVRDRMVQATIRGVIEPIFEREFAEHAYGFRIGRSAQMAIQRVEELMEQGYSWVVDADLKGYFDSIPQDRLMEAVRSRIADGRLLGLIEAYLRQGVMESGKGWTPTEKGTPQGAVLSPLLANLYLNPLDHRMAQEGYRMTRYADDFIIQCSSREEAEEALAEVREWVEKAGLSLHPTKTRIVNATVAGGFDFLGWHFERGLKWPRKKSLDRFRETIRKETLRTSGQSLACIHSRLNRRFRGWINYFGGGVRNVYEALDGWTRGRLRSILRKRDKRKGRGRGRDHNRYTNAYFAERGLISLSALDRVKRTSPARKTCKMVGGNH